RASHRSSLTSYEVVLLVHLGGLPFYVDAASGYASQVWDMNFDSDSNVIDVAIRRLRAKIDDAFNPKLIHTVRGMGYTLDAPDDAPAP
ncbi:winged helix-turn-helix domain-containing protein, partial [Pseudomonas aeruginosa]|uniref:winged helix-turn-helix domain-containing protein n=1 Tax=Pseudomonas aeruginosa TaxID=287 RepID=UPI00384B86ED